MKSGRSTEKTERDPLHPKVATFRMTEEQKTRLTEEADAAEMTLSEYGRMVLMEWRPQHLRELVRITGEQTVMNVIFEQGRRTAQLLQQVQELLEHVLLLVRGESAPEVPLASVKPITQAEVEQIEREVASYAPLIRLRRLHLVESQMRAAMNGDGGIGEEEEE